MSTSSPTPEAPARQAAYTVDADARRRAMGDWRRRSRRVRFWRRALPWLMVAIVVGVGGWIAVRTVVSALSQRAATSQIRMTNPRFYGRDDKGRSFVLTAQEAERVPGDIDRIVLTKPGLRLDIGRPQPAVANAAKGVYQERSRQLELSGGVAFTDGQGNRFQSDKARVDTRTGQVTGESQVVGEGPLGRIAASSYSILDDGSRALFTGGVRAHLLNGAAEK